MIVKSIRERHRFEDSVFFEDEADESSIGDEAGAGRE